MHLVRDGAPLAQIAGLLDLPNWMRRLPPEAFQHSIGKVANGDAFGRKIVGRLPKEADHAAAWLQAHEIGVEAAGEDFAYWLASQPIYASPFHGEAPVRPLAIFAWFSRRDDVRGRRMMQKPWNKQMRFAAAVQQMCAWYERVLSDLTRADMQRGPGRYSRRRRGNGYVMVPLRSAAELHEEGHVMDNCVGTYAGMVAARECAIYSVRRGTLRVATLEVRWGNGKARITQLEGPGNSVADPAIWRAAQAWLAEQEDFFLATPAAIANMRVDATRWKALWMPYVNAMGSQMMQLERPDQRALAKLLIDVEQLVIRARG